MAHFAKVINDIVVEVIVAEQEYINTLENKNEWIQTSYNTFRGQHKLGGTPLRKNYAGVGFTYDSERDAFIPPKPYDSWTLDEETCDWVAPTARPSKAYEWSEEEVDWVLIQPGTKT